MSAIECKSEEGITIGLIDAMISISRILAKRIQKGHTNNLTKNIQEALIDFYKDDDCSMIISKASLCVMEKLNKT